MKRLILYQQSSLCYIEKWKDGLSDRYKHNILKEGGSR